MFGGVCGARGGDHAASGGGGRRLRRHRPPAAQEGRLDRGHSRQRTHGQEEIQVLLHLREAAPLRRVGVREQRRRVRALLRTRGEAPPAARAAASYQRTTGS